MDSNNQTISIEDVKLPPGYRFKPNDSELITCYLIRKILNNRPLPTTAIKDIAFYDFDPEQLPIAYCRDKEAYFFTQVVPGRITKSGGQWKVSGPDFQVTVGAQVAGSKTCFVFYSAEEEERTKWTMREYRVNPGLTLYSQNEILKSKIDTYVICKVRYKEDDENLNLPNDDHTFQTISIEDVKLPRGFRFAPTRTELIRDYLINKILNRPLPTTAIMDYIDFYDIDPDQLPISDKFLAYYRDKEGYGFTQLVPGRTTRSGGHWKAHAREMSVMSGDKVIGSKTYFVYHSAREKECTHNWTMHEYRVDPGFMIQAESTDETLKSKVIRIANSDSVCLLQIDSAFVICKVKYVDFLKFPPGYYFKPTDTELITDYLINKILNRPVLYPIAIKDIIFFYDLDPEQLIPIGQFLLFNDFVSVFRREAYFYTQVVEERRTTKSGGGCWKASGQDVLIKRGDEVIGFKKYFVFYSAGEKKSTDWTMYEYRVNPGFMIPANAPNVTLKRKVRYFCDMLRDKFLAYYRDKEGYGFTQVVPGRTTRSGGHWKAHAREMSVMSGDKVIGSKTYFVYYSAREKECTHNWTMHEYRVDPGFMIQAESTDETLKSKVIRYFCDMLCMQRGLLRIVPSMKPPQIRMKKPSTMNPSSRIRANPPSRMINLKIHDIQLEDQC
ncbi:hypothetical protein EZV62_013568 [Acer yangbiense]|uniref:NAC domain-containing protein n=1 Tax=Acer yangbiense TaxID=1000413 RepID=A0A5C7HZC4_9ROSI|nr:hypothetical protein EZV62_013568 [Acer yangbiense]